MWCWRRMEKIQCEKMRKRRKTLRPACNNAGGEPSFDPTKGSRVPRHSLFAPVNFELWPKGLISNLDMAWYRMCCCAQLVQFVLALLFMFFAVVFSSWSVIHLSTSEMMCAVMLLTVICGSVSHRSPSVI